MKRLASIAILLSAWSVRADAVPALSPKSRCGEGAVAVTGGCVRGEHAGAVAAFRGIPYAAPPIGALRWRPPAPVAAWLGTRDATSFGKACPQLDDTIGGKLEWSEDCLTLNVWTPRAEVSATLPVMVWIHGGSLVQGGSAIPSYSGEHLAGDGDVVVVSMNYRLGPLGFLSHPAMSAEDHVHHVSGDYGLLDQIAALEWVRANAAAFGGDPKNVTIFGESAGGESVCALMASPSATGLFARAIIESAQCVGYGQALRRLRGDTKGESAEAQGTRIAHALGCDGDDDQALACMRGKSLDQLLHVSPAAFGFLGKGEHFGLVVEGNVLAEAPRDLLDAGKLAAVPTLLGTNRDEATMFTTTLSLKRPLAYAGVVAKLFPGKGREVLAHYPPTRYGSPKQTFDALVTDLVFGCPARRTARALRGHQAHVYRYLFTHVTSRAKSPALGATHGTEIPYVFGTLPSPTDDERELSRTMLHYWTQFARTGDPNFTGSPTWPVYDQEHDPYLELEAPATARESLHAVECDLLDSVKLAGSVPDKDEN